MRINTDIESADELTQKELEYLRDHPERLSLFDNRELVYNRVLVRVLALAIVFIASSKLISYQYADQISQFMNDVVVDTVFELGAALLGAVATVFFIEHQQKRQYDANVKLRYEIERRLAELEQQ